MSSSSYTVSSQSFIPMHVTIVFSLVVHIHQFLRILSPTFFLNIFLISQHFPTIMLDFISFTVLSCSSFSSTFFKYSFLFSLCISLRFLPSSFTFHLLSSVTCFTSYYSTYIPFFCWLYLVKNIPLNAPHIYRKINFFFFIMRQLFEAGIR